MEEFPVWLVVQAWVPGDLTWAELISRDLAVRLVRVVSIQRINQAEGNVDDNIDNDVIKCFRLVNKRQLRVHEFNLGSLGSRDYLGCNYLPPYFCFPEHKFGSCLGIREIEKWMTNCTIKYTRLVLLAKASISSSLLNACVSLYWFIVEVAQGIIRLTQINRYWTIKYYFSIYPVVELWISCCWRKSNIKIGSVDLTS